jgi:hypothetical protein
MWLRSRRWGVAILPDMSLRDWVDRKLGGSAVDDPDELLEVCTLPLMSGPLAVRGLQSRGIDAHMTEAFNPVLKTTALNAVIRVRRRDFLRAYGVLQELGFVNEV